MIRLCKAAGVPAPQFRQDGGQFVQTLRRPTGGDGARFVRPESGLESRLHRQVVLTIPKRLRPYCLYRRALLVPRGSVGRTPALWDLALRLAYELPLRRGLRGRFVLDVLHVGNPRRATTAAGLRGHRGTDARGHGRTGAQAHRRTDARGHGRVPLLESGHAVVADFGIARAVSAAGSERLTETQDGLDPLLAVRREERYVHGPGISDSL
jgi:hypothetical protein